MELCTKWFFQPLTIFEKSSILDVWQGSELLLAINASKRKAYFCVLVTIFLFFSGYQTLKNYIFLLKHGPYFLLSSLRFYLRQRFALSCEDVIFIPSALTFDASLLLMFLAWSCCATVVLVSEDVLRSPVSLARILENCRVTFLQVKNDHYCGNPVVNFF